MKDNAFPIEIPGLVYPFNEDNVYLIAQEIRSVFPDEKLITPADLRTHATLEASIQANGWPTLGESRGKVLFFTLSDIEIAGTVFASNGNLSNNANTIFKTLDNSVGSYTQINQAIQSGFMVRTRADAGTIEARTGNTGPRDAAMSSGAQIVSTDYYKPDYRYLLTPQDWTDYSVQWPGQRTARWFPSAECFSD